MTDLFHGTVYDISKVESLPLLTIPKVHVEICRLLVEWEDSYYCIMPEIFYKEMDKMFEELGANFEDTDDKEKIREADNFVTTFTPDNKPIVID